MYFFFKSQVKFYFFFSFFLTNLLILTKKSKINTDSFNEQFASEGME